MIFEHYNKRINLTLKGVYNKKIEFKNKNTKFRSGKFNALVFSFEIVLSLQNRRLVYLKYLTPLIIFFTYINYLKIKSKIFEFCPRLNKISQDRMGRFCRLRH